MGPDPNLDFDLTRAILARTSGAAACERAGEQLGSLLDGDLEPGRAALLEGHLAHCGTCAARVAVLRRARADLRIFAVLDPGPWFAARVLRACRPAPGRGWLGRLLHRPRIALEAAYVGAALGLLAFHLPLPGRPGGVGTPPVARVLAPLRPGVGALTQGLHAMAEALTPKPEPPRTEPGKPPARPGS